MKVQFVYVPDVLLDPVIHGDFLIYIWERMIVPVVYGKKLEEN